VKSLSQNRTCSKLWNKISKFTPLKSWLFTLEIFLQKRLIYIDFEINFQCERGIMAGLQHFGNFSHMTSNQHKPCLHSSRKRNVVSRCSDGQVSSWSAVRGSITQTSHVSVCLPACLPAHTPVYWHVCRTTISVSTSVISTSVSPAK